MYIYIIYLKEDVPRWLTEYEKKIGIRQEGNQKNFHGGLTRISKGPYLLGMAKAITRSIDFHGTPVEITLTDENGTRSESEMNGMMNWYAKQVQSFLDEFDKPVKTEFKWKK